VPSSSGPEGALLGFPESIVLRMERGCFLLLDGASLGWVKCLGKFLARVSFRVHLLLNSTCSV
jgi:hypothetical protein